MAIITCPDVFTRINFILAGLKKIKKSKKLKKLLSGRLYGELR